MFAVSRPSTREIESFLDWSRGAALSYSPIGLARARAAGFQTDEESVVIGQGAKAFEAAQRGLTHWRQFDLGWIEIFPSNPPIVPGGTVAVLVRHLGFWSLNGCRVVYLIDHDGESGFAYGTLSNHAASGEEIFTVSHNPDTGEVRYLIRAVSGPRAILAQLGRPFARSLQARFRRESAEAMRRAVTDA